MIERILRWTAILIAAFAAIDPQVTLAGRIRPTVGVLLSGADAAAHTVQHALQRALANDFDVVSADDPNAKALVVVGDYYPDEPIAQSSNVSTVTIAKAPAAAVSIQGLSAPKAVPAATTTRLGVDVAGSRVRGTTSQLSIRIHGAEVAHRSHTWGADDEVWHEDVDVVPVGQPPFVFNVQADRDSRTVAIDRGGALRVLVIESRPSWTTAFVRRALEDDPRFDVSGLSVPAPQALVRSGASPAIPDDLRAFDVILAGGLEKLSASNLTTFERFCRERGGTLVLLPDAAIPSALSQRLLPGITFRETLLERPAVLDSTVSYKLQASELLEAARLPNGSEVLVRAGSSQQPVVWNIPFGDGRIVVSGAMDAWRYRGGDAAVFDRFWRSLVAGAALSARPPIDVHLIPDRAAEGDRFRIVAQVRTLEREQLGARLAISARVGAAPTSAGRHSPCGTSPAWVRW